MKCYHGTDEVSALSIIKSGFRKGTYFAFDFWDAVKFGGEIVFTAEFDESPEKWKGEKDGWQFHLRDDQSPEIIVSIVRVVATPFVTTTSKETCRYWGLKTRQTVKEVKG